MVGWTEPFPTGDETYVHAYESPERAERIYGWFKECAACGFAMSAVVRQPDVVERIFEDRLPLVVCAWQCDRCGQWQDTRFSEEMRYLLRGRS